MSVYTYVLTQQSIAEKAMLAGRFLKRKLQDYDALRAEIDALQAELPHSEEGGTVAHADSHLPIPYRTI